LLGCLDTSIAVHDFHPVNQQDNIIKEKLTQNALHVDERTLQGCSCHTAATDLGCTQATLPRIPAGHDPLPLSFVRLVD